MIKVKICGITRVEDALLASKLGAWALGFIFVKTSPRYIQCEKVAQIVNSLPENVEKIGVFANSPVDEMQSIVKIANLTKIQLHGDETPDFCIILKEKTGLPIIKAIRIKDFNSLQNILQYKNSASAVLLDSYSSEELGGTGKSFDMNIAIEAKKFGMQIILAGGINSCNIKEAYLKVQPYAIDVSSGVERAKGIKDNIKLKDLFNLLG